MIYIMMTQIDTSEEGNTKPLRNRCRKYCGTLNNYSEKEYDHLKVMTQKCERFIIGKEVGENGTPHLQMYIEFKNAISFNTLKGWNERIHWEKAKGNVKDNYKYCSKDNDFIQKGMLSKQDELKLKLKSKYNEFIWYNWQKQVIDICASEANDRTINWIYDYDGGKGKSTLRKYLALNYDCIICDGKKQDVLNQLKTKVIDEDKDIKIVIMDIPRHCNDYINYGLLEQLKDGHVYSGKYEGGEIFLDNIHVIVFSNELPDFDKFTKDRWNVIDLGAVGVDGEGGCLDGIQTFRS